jgi:hypothetical protein
MEIRRGEFLLPARAPRAVARPRRRPLARVFVQPRYSTRRPP